MSKIPPHRDRNRAEEIESSPLSSPEATPRGKGRAHARRSPTPSSSSNNSDSFSGYRLAQDVLADIEDDFAHERAPVSENRGVRSVIVHNTEPPLDLALGLPPTLVRTRIPSPASALASNVYVNTTISGDTGYTDPIPNNPSEANLHASQAVPARAHKQETLQDQPSG
jgi:hypothetical protein